MFIITLTLLYSACTLFIMARYVHQLIYSKDKKSLVLKVKKVESPLKFMGKHMPFTADNPEVNG